ncbi:MAG: hypothetical protein L3J71_04730 [Victivallaceae bacterium]|nr:hypothetical protein [Victivallaceae bacterium]
MIKRKKQYFNMIEIALAIAIIAFGMSSILVLFPVGLNASRDSMADNYSADAVEQFVSYIQAYANKGATEYDNLFITSTALYFITDTQPPATDINLDSFGDNVLPPSPLTSGFLKELRDDSVTSRIAGWDLYQAYDADNGGTSGSKKQIYFLVHRSNSPDITPAKYDFMATMAIWKSPVTVRIYTKTVGALEITESTLYDDFAALNIEISWPLNKPYKDRQKRYYQFTIKKP